MKPVSRFPTPPGPVRAAARRSPATVALDLRLAGRAAAVAVDGRGTPVAWALLSGDGDSVALARRALRELRVRPKKVLVLLGTAGTGGTGEAQVAVLAHSGTPGEGAITAALYAEGYERLGEPSVAALAVSPDAWLVTACDAAAIEPLAAGLLEESETEPVFVVDQLLAVESLAACSALIEHGETGLLIAADPPESTAFVRSLPAVSDVEEAARESRESLEAAGFDGPVQVRGPHRDLLSRLLAESGVAARAEALPASGGETLPPACELAWQLALRPTVPPLSSPRSERRRTSLAWARRATRVALVLAALGFLLMVAGLKLGFASRERNRALYVQAAGDARLVGELQELGALAEDVEQLRTELTGWTAPWPRLAKPVATLARQLPPEVAWERLQITAGALELEASAAGSAPAARLELLRQALQSSPGIVNLSWAPPAADPKSLRLRQVFRATLKGAPEARPQETRGTR